MAGDRICSLWLCPKNGIDRLELEANDEKLSAILYQITIIGEATKRLFELKILSTHSGKD
jgi:hypothetical protein